MVGSLGFVFPMIRGIALLLLSVFFLMISSAEENLSDLYHHIHMPIALFFFGDGVFDAGIRARIESDTNFNHAEEGLLWPPYRITPYEAQVKSMWRYGVSFATIQTSTTSLDKSVPLWEQVKNFGEVHKYLEDTYGEEKTNNLLSNSIYIFSLGPIHFNGKPPKNFEELGETIDNTFNSFRKAMESIYKGGGRKFAFQSIYKEKKDYEQLDSPTLVKDILKHQLQHWATCTNKDGSQWLKGAKYSYFDNYYQFLADAS